MLFSFIVPVYNTSKYLEQCIESILCQKGADFEILLVDDGSTDNSGNMCDAYAERYPDTVRVIHKANEGLLLTRRRGFKEANGDWFICIDSDDYADSQLLEIVVDSINEYHPDMVMYNFQYTTDSGDFLKSRLSIPDNTVYTGEKKAFIYSQRLLTDAINNMWTKAIKREIVDIDADYSGCGIKNMCEDAVQVLPLFTNAKKIVYLSKPLYYYRKSEGSITATRSYEKWIASMKCFLETEKYLNIWNISDQLRYEFYTHQLEVLSNFLRWVFSQPEINLPKSKNAILVDIHNHPAFQRCIKMYNKSYAHSGYLKICVPKIMKYVLLEDTEGLDRLFTIEKRLLSLVRK